MAAMSTLRYWWAQWSLTYYRIALQQIDPMHEDVQHIVSEINRIEASLRRRLL